MKLAAGAALVVLLLGLVLRVERYVLADGYVIAETYAEVRPTAAGIVAEICARTGTQVNKDDLLVQLDDSAEQAARREATLRADKMAAELVQRTTETAEQRRKLDESVTRAKLQLEHAERKLTRFQTLMAKGMVAASEYEDAKLAAALARAELASLTAIDHSVFEQELDVIRRELDAQREAAQRAEAQARMRQIRAPIDGEVLRYEFARGELVRPESVLMEIFGGDKRLLKLYVPERHAARVAKGQAYRAKLTSLNGLRSVWFDGHVGRLRNVIQGEGASRYRVAYCQFDPGTWDVPYGASAEARIYYGRSCLWLYLLGMDW
ncbi:MAG: HlyD family efflux transporter periplasmic adaptor subunit [Kiritimatiellae bacterium]|nr:HlyD family efflux transporter periplasmic adaptor subunit [Kiritimatiellia bacterium]